MQNSRAGWRRLLRVRAAVDAQVAADVEHEIGFHIASRTAELEREGLGAERAREQAEREFGDVARARRSLRKLASSTERHVRRSELLHELWHDARYAARRLRTSPAFTATAVLTLA